MTIKSIEKGTGESSTYFTTDKREIGYFDEIKRETENIGKGYYNDLLIDVYNCYRGGKLIATIESNSSLTILYY